jgi:hypothetical protein
MVSGFDDSKGISRVAFLTGIKEAVLFRQAMNAPPIKRE